MALNKKDFLNSVDTGLKADTSYKKFYFRFKHEGKEYAKLFDYSSNNWDKRTRTTKAKADAISFRENKINSLGSNPLGFSETSTLNKIAEAYFGVGDKSENWLKELKNTYRLYIANDLGKKKIKNIKLHDIKLLRSSMEERGHSKQTENGCSPRTIKKVLIQTLKPIMEYALDNQIINHIPKIELSRAHRNANKKRKKTVNNAGIKLATVYRVINELYSEDPFYRALFLFALYGRRWNEIKTLKWSEIDFDNNTYTIKAENNKIGEDQSYGLAEPIRNSLSQLNDNQGLIFKSPVTGRELSTPKKQLAKIKTASNIEELTMHYFRHILVSAMGEIGTASTILSASLGHVNLQTVNDFYLSANHTRASNEANIAIENITQNQTEVQ